MSALITAIVSAALMGGCGRSTQYVPPAALHYAERPVPLPPRKLEQQRPEADRVEIRERPRPRDLPPAEAATTRPADKKPSPLRPKGSGKAPQQEGQRERRIWVPEPLPGRFLTFPGRR